MSPKNRIDSLRSTHTVGFVLILLSFFSASGCSSGSNDDGNSPSDSSTSTREVFDDEIPAESDMMISAVDPTPAMTNDVRLKTRTIDRSNDGVDDQITEYEYDDSGRVVMQTVEDLISASSVVYVFDYGVDGKLLTKTNGQETDSYTYEDGRLVAADRVANGELSYRYDDGGRLIGVTGEGFFFDDDCALVSIDGTFPTPEYVVSYTDGLIDQVVDTIGLDMATVSRDESDRLLQIVYSGECYVSASQRDEYTYDSQGRLSEIFIEGTGFRDVDIVSLDYENDQVVAITRETFGRDAGESSTLGIVRAFDSQSQLVSEQVTQDGVQLGQIRYTYEQGTCLQPGSADPSNILNVESARLQSSRTPALLCGYWFDEGDF